MLKQPILPFDIELANQGAPSTHANSFTSPYYHQIDAQEVLSGDGAHLVHMKFHAASPACITILPKRPFILLHFSVQSGRTYTFPEDTAGGGTVGEMQSQLFYIHDKPFQFSVAAGVNEAFEISMTTDYFKALLPDGHDLYGALDRLTGAGAQALHHPPVPVCARTKIALHEAQYHRLGEACDPLYIRAKIMELLAYQQANQVEERRLAHAAPSLPEEERQRMYHARAIIADNLDNPPSIKELARLVGTNECYLKNNFKAVFGNTVYGYAKQARMEKAHKLLTTQSRKVSEVAQLVGYRHASHFTAAFKQYFGYTPNHVNAPRGKTGLP